LSAAEATHGFASPRISARRLHITFSWETRKRKAVFDESAIKGKVAKPAKLLLQEVKERDAVERCAQQARIFQSSGCRRGSLNPHKSPPSKHPA
jgi:hypothetical protein